MASRSQMGSLVIIDGQVVTPESIPDEALVTPPGSPGAHASSHASGGGDPLTLSQSQITGLVDALGAKLHEAAVQDIVNGAIASLISSAPGALDTLDELAAALGDDANFAATVTSALALKAPLASPTFTGTVTVPDGSFTVAKTSGLQAALDAKSPVVFVGAGAPNSDHGVNATTFQSVLSKALTGLAVGDQVVLELEGSLLNNSGAARTYNYRVGLGSFTTDLADGASMTNHASNRSMISVRATFSISATNAVRCTFEVRRYGPAAAGGDSSLVLAQCRAEWNTSGSNLTGNQSVTFLMHGGNATGTQTFTMHRWSICKLGAI